ncbi:hypothetical protein EG329_004450 [Mollisiaceae sp. DMI_Dod_QoI]|nr:hypothetical protein EG329_004450 [Helotiales sp. DMI_Dod_QoI]
MTSPPPSSLGLSTPSTEISPLPTDEKPKPTMTIQIPIRTSYFNSSSISAPNSTTTSATTSRTQTPLTSGSNTPLTEKFPKAKYLCHLPQVDKNGQPLDVLSRIYPKPMEDIDIGEALGLPALPGTLRNVVRKEVKGNERRRKQTSEEKRAEFERVKRDLRGLG